VKAESVQVCAIRRPLRLGDCPSFYRPRRRQFTSCRTASSRCGGVACSACFCWDVMASHVLVQERLRGWRYRGRLFGSCPRGDSRVPLTGGRTGHSSGRGDVLSPHASTALGMVMQCPGWRRDGGHAVLTSRRSPGQT
jgi:hypothetical protein